jgi:hypothetical protein
VIKGLGQRLRRGDRRAAAGLRDDIDDRFFMGQTALHRVGGAVEKQ